MKRKTILFSILVLVTAALAACSASPQAAEVRTLSINGSGMVYASPDKATINLGVVSEADDVQAATAESNQVIEKIKEVLVEFGVAEADVQTTHFSVYPVSDYGFGPDVALGEEPAQTRYRVDNMVTITVRELDSLGEVLNAAINAGANSIHGIEYGITDKESAYDQALEAAVANAEQRAAYLAEASGAGLGELLTISTNYGSSGYFPAYVEMAAGLGGGGSVPVSPGSLVIRVDVSVVYELN
jgi:uncharacterized protein YggE